MKILLVTPYFYPKIGGVERHTYNIALGLLQHGHEVHVLTTLSDPSFASKELLDGIHVTRLPINFTISMTPIGFGWLKTIRKIIRDIDPDIIEAHAPVPGFADLAYFARQGRKYVIKYHSGDMKKGKNKIIDFLLGCYQKTVLKYIFLHADAIMAVYPEYVEKLINYKRTVHFIPPGVDTSLFKPAKLKKIYDVLYVGRIEHASDWKGINVLLEATAKIKKAHKNIRVALAGGGDAIEYYKSLADKLGITDNINFLGSVQGKDLVDTYNKSSILVLPSLTEAESFGNTLIEAMACKVPVIGSRIGGIPNVIDNEVDGFLFEPGSSKELSAIITKILDKPDVAQKISQFGFNKANKIFSVEMLNKKTDELLRSTAKKEVVHVIAHYPPSTGGMQTAIEELVYHQAESQVNSRVITTNIGYKKDYEDRNRVTRLYAFEIFHTPIIPGLFFSLMKLKRTSIIHVHVAQAGIPELCAIVAKIKGLVCIMHVHANVGASGVMGKILPLYKMCFLGPALRSASHVITPSSSYQKLISEMYSISKSNISVIPSGVNNIFFSQKVNKGNISKFRLLCVGRLTVEKNIDVIIEAVSKTDFSIELTIVGDGPLLSSLKKQASLIENKLVTIIFAGRISRDDIAKYYSHTDVFLLASSYESQSLVVLEAMATGLPVIASNIPAIDEIVTKNNGILCPINSVEFYDAIRELHNSPTLRNNMSKFARKLAYEYTWDRTTNKMDILYDELT